MKKNILIILLSVFFLSCSSDDDTTEMTNTEITNIEFSLIGKGNLYGNGAEGITQQNLIISDETTWNDLITQMNFVNPVSDRFIETDINFSEHTIIAVFDEVKGTSGHNLELLSLTYNSENIIVNISDFVPGGFVTGGITQPFHILKITNTGLPILFE